jgi:hypothetical protein
LETEANEKVLNCSHHMDYLKSRTSRLLFILQFKVSPSAERFKKREIHEREEAAYFKVTFNFPVFHFAVTAN